MIDLLRRHVMDILAGGYNGLYVYSGGTAYPIGWSGQVQPDRGAAPAGGYVNLFDRGYSKDDLSALPAIYPGDEAMAAEDEAAFATVSGGVPAGTAVVEYRKLSVALMIVCGATGSPGLYSAAQERDQLRNNARRILLQHRVEPGYWWLMELPGQVGASGIRDTVWESGGGGNLQQGALAFARMPVVIQYSYVPGSSA